MNSRKSALTTPVIVITGMPAIRNLAIGEFSKMSFRRQGMMAAATTVPKKVMAMTPVAQRKMPWKLGRNAQRALTTREGTIMRISEPYGTRRFAEILAAHSGSTRSKAAAKITRVEDRNTVPAQPKNHKPITRMISAWRRWLFTSQPAYMTGQGQPGTGAVPDQYAALASL